MDIKDLKNKRTTLSDIPIVIQNAVGYLDNFGLEVEGVFRKSGSASQIEYPELFDRLIHLRYFKEQYDQGVEVDLKKCPDPHTIAGLLKLYPSNSEHFYLSFFLTAYFRDIYENFLNLC